MGKERRKMDLEVVEELELSDEWENTALSALVMF